MLTARENTLSMLNFLLSLSYFLYLSTRASGGTPRERAEELTSDQEYTRYVEACARIVYMKRRYLERAAVLHSMVRVNHAGGYSDRVKSRAGRGWYRISMYGSYWSKFG